MWEFAQTPLASEAQQNASDNASDALSRLTEKMGELRSLLATIRPEFEYTGPRVVGGVPSATPIRINVPFASPCEVSVALACTTEPTTTAPITLLLSTNSNLDIGASNASTITATLDGNQRFLLVVSFFTNSLVGPDRWFALSGEEPLFLHIHGTSTNAAYMTLQFRRRINPVGVPSPGY